MSNQYTTGAIKSIKDNRNIQYSSLPQAIAQTNIPDKFYTNISILPVENQGSRGACVAYTIAKQLQYKEWKETGVLKPLSKRFIYTLTRQLMGWVGNPQEGLMPLPAFKVVMNGTWDRDVLDDTNLPASEYERMNITDGMKAEAYPYRIGGYAQATDLVSVQKGIMLEGMVAVSLPYGNGNFNQALLSPFTKEESRHYVNVFGWETIGGRIRFAFLNHWTENWGEKGVGYFYWDEYQGLAYDMFTCADVPNEIKEKAKNTAFIFTTDIAKYSRGPLVTELQKALTTLGYYSGPITGYFGDMTAQAVTRFQKANGIPTNNGKNVGPQTRAKLNELLNNQKKTELTRFNLKPKVEALCNQFLVECNKAGYQVAVTEGFRSLERQQSLYNQGRTTTGPKVTNAPAGYSFHNYGVAFDVAFMVNGAFSFQGDWTAIGNIGKKLGLEWGGDWGSFQDKPHFQYSGGYTIEQFKNNQVNYGIFEIGGKPAGDTGYNLVEYNQSNKTLMNNLINELINGSRLRSLLWRIGMMVLAFLIGVGMKNLTALHLSAEMTVFLGLILGEVSKAINNYLSQDTTLG